MVKIDSPLSKLSDGVDLLPNMELVKLVVKIPLVMVWLELFHSSGAY